MISIKSTPLISSHKKVIKKIKKVGLRSQKKISSHPATKIPNIFKKQGKHILQSSYVPKELEEKLAHYQHLSFNAIYELNFTYRPQQFAKELSNMQTATKRHQKEIQEILKLNEFMNDIDKQNLGDNDNNSFDIPQNLFEIKQSDQVSLNLEEKHDEDSYQFNFKQICPTTYPHQFYTENNIMHDYDRQNDLDNFLFG